MEFAPWQRMLDSSSRTQTWQYHYLHTAIMETPLTSSLSHIVVSTNKDQWLAELKRNSIMMESQLSLLAMGFWFPGHACSFDACSQPWDIKSGGSDGTQSTGNSTVRSQVAYLAPGDKPIAGSATQEHSANPRIIFPEPLVGMSVATSRDSSLVTTISCRTTGSRSNQDHARGGVGLRWKVDA
ncbi:hypothetical protein CCHR01_12665 [Colletotrichum chrysophilum]|uniref:Ig-like domain-containing protein n=1 Tax=Colletotrichum chrysophilum TaxID=1836956 RepID=A0AAD9EDM7_9PEZI|nr:hypothetical protein CCHR01_12665 [Colletotrichum chrysophilum]